MPRRIILPRCGGVFLLSTLSDETGVSDMNYKTALLGIGGAFLLAFALTLIGSLFPKPTYRLQHDTHLTDYYIRKAMDR